MHDLTIPRDVFVMRVGCPSWTEEGAEAEGVSQSACVYTAVVVEPVSVLGPFGSKVYALSTANLT